MVRKRKSPPFFWEEVFTPEQRFERAAALLNELQLLSDPFLGLGFVDREAHHPIQQ